MLFLVKKSAIEIWINDRVLPSLRKTCLNTTIIVHVVCYLIGSKICHFILLYEFREKSPAIIIIKRNP